MNLIQPINRWSAWDRYIWQQAAYWSWRYRQAINQGRRHIASIAAVQLKRYLSGQ